MNRKKKLFINLLLVLLYLACYVTCVTHSYAPKESTQRIIAGDTEGALAALRGELPELEAAAPGLKDQEIHNNVTQRWKNIHDQANMLNILGRYQEAIGVCETYIRRYDEDRDLLRRYYDWQRKKLKANEYGWKAGTAESTMVTSLGALQQQIMNSYFSLQDRENTYRYATLLLENMGRWTQKPYHLYVLLQQIFLEYDDLKRIEEISAHVDRLANNPPSWMAQNPDGTGLTSILATTRFFYHFYKKDYPKAEEHLRGMITLTGAFQAQLKSVQSYSGGLVPENIDFLASLQAVLADLQLRQGKIREARETFREYEERMIAWQSELVISRQQWTMEKLKADIARANGDLSGAIAHYRTSEEKFERTRAFLQGTRFKILFPSAQTELFDSLVSVLTEKGQHGLALEYSERSRSRAFLDMMADNKVAIKNADSSGLMEQREQLLHTLKEQTMQLSRASESQRGATSRGIGIKLKKLDAVEGQISTRFPELASTITFSVTAPSVLQTSLDPGTKVVEYYLSEDELFIWVVGRSRIHGTRVPLAGKSRVKHLVEQLRISLMSFDSADFKRFSGDLYDLLIHPVADEIDGARRLCVIPHSVLHYLPFGLLKNEGRFLLEDYEIFNAPSLNIYAICRAKGRPKNFSILALGNPDLGDRTAALPFAEKEVESIGRSFPDSLVYTGTEATETLFFKMAPERSIIHLAAHGFYDTKKPMLSGIILAGRDRDDRVLTAAEVFNMQIDAYAVVLSACETALGARTDGDEIIGLTRAFLYAGTPSVISTLWKVNDEATAFLMTAFYNNLAQMNKAQALRQAQLQTKNLFANPFYWGAFVLSGDWE